MLKSILSILLIFSISLLSSQEIEDNFPNSILGIYKGDLHISSARGVQKVPMEFHLQKTDSIHKFKYILVYNGTPRNYTLITKSVEKGIFEVDENNGIILPSKYANNTLYSFFEVQGNFLSSRLHFKKDRLDFEILFTATKNKTTTGGISKEIPVVYGYPITTIQKAILRKEK